VCEWHGEHGWMEETTHYLKGSGNKLMMRPNFTKFFVKVKFKV